MAKKDKNKKDKKDKVAKKAIKAAKPEKAAKAHKAAKAPKAPKVKAKAKSKVSPVPKGAHTVTPMLCFKDSAKAIAFYQEAFGAKEISRMASPDGKSTWHAEIRIGDSFVFMSDESPMGSSAAATPEHRATAAMQLYVKDCDTWFERAVKAGARALMPVGDMFWGDRMGSVVDPFGVCWMLATRVANLTPKQAAAAGEEFARKMAASSAPPEAEAAGNSPAPAAAPSTPHDPQPS